MAKNPLSKIEKDAQTQSMERLKQIGTKEVKGTLRKIIVDTDIRTKGARFQKRGDN